MNNEQTSDKKQFITIRPYTIRELSRLYGVSRITFRRWLNKFKQELGDRAGRYYSIPQVKVIFKHLDFPSIIEVKE
jgi:transposase-like protein